MKAFLSPVPLNVGPSVESRGHDSPLGAVPIHCCPASLPKQDVPSEELHKEGNISRSDCKHHCSGSDNPYSRITPKPRRKGVNSFDTTLTEIPCGNSVCRIQMFLLAGSVSPPANVKPNICRLDRVHWHVVATVTWWLQPCQLRRVLIVDSVKKNSEPWPARKSEKQPAIVSRLNFELGQSDPRGRFDSLRRKHAHRLIM